MAPDGTVPLRRRGWGRGRRIASLREERATFCRVCEPACGLVATLEDGAVAALRPDPEHPVSRGFACHKGIAALEIHRDPDRVDQPQRRAADGRFERASWDDALAGVAGELARIRDAHGGDAIAFYLGNPSAFNTLVGPAAGALAARLGVRRLFGSGTQDCANKFAGSEAVFGSSTIHPVPDLDHTDHLLLFGTNPRVSHMSFLSIADPMEKLRAARRRGATVRFVNPRRIESVSPSTGEWVPIRPDADLYLLAAMLCELDRTGRFDERVLAEHGRNVAGLRAFVRRYPPERVAGVTGIAADEIRRLAREFADAPSAAVQMSTGVNMGRQGTLAYWLLWMLSFCTGNLDRRGGNLYSLGFYPAARAGRVDPERAFFESRYGRIRRIRGALPGNLLADEIEDPERPIRALVVVAGNPLLSMGGEARLRRAFARLEFLVCIDLYRNATGELAHWVLPAADMLERADVNLTGLGLQHRPFVQFADALVPPRAERREEWWIFSELERALSGAEVTPRTEDETRAALWSRIDHMLASSGLSLDALRARPRGTAVLPEPPVGCFFEDWIQTPDRRVDCCPALFGEALERAERIFAELDAEPPGRLKLVTRREPRTHNSWYGNLPALRRRNAHNPLYLHPDDARERGVEAGARVRVGNQWGEVEAEVAFDPGLVRGVVALSHGWGHAAAPSLRAAAAHPGVNANALLPTGPGSFEPLSNQAHMTGIPVEISPA